MLQFIIHNKDKSATFGSNIEMLFSFSAVEFLKKGNSTDWKRATPPNNDAIPYGAGL